MTRSDISTKVIHFTKGTDDREAFTNLRSIIEMKRIIPGRTKIKGQYPCVCFTEAPLSSLSQGLVNASATGRYTLFGVVFQKSWLFSLGGRPVIYESADELNTLPEEIRWRHMRYEPNRTPPIDFTWEREWRLNREIEVTPDVAEIVVPNKSWLEQLKSFHNSDHEATREYQGRMYSLIMDENLAEQYASTIPQEAFPWSVYYF